MTRAAAAFLGVLLALLLPAIAQARQPEPSVRVVRIVYRAHDGLPRKAYVILPSWYGPERDPPIPLVISPHGRGVGARINVRRWGSLPARGGFAVINPEGQGRMLTLFSWGDEGRTRRRCRSTAICRSR
jgi:poly(3-hydroxybutyrate) depolymerase